MSYSILLGLLTLFAYFHIPHLVQLHHSFINMQIMHFDVCYWPRSDENKSGYALLIVAANFVGTLCGDRRWQHLPRLDVVYTHTRLTALCPGLPGWAGTRKVKPICILLKQETVSGICWAICKSAPRSRQITMPAPHRSIFIGRVPFLSPNQQCQRYLSIPCLRSIRTRLQAGFLSEGCTRLSTN